MRQAEAGRHSSSRCSHCSGPARVQNLGDFTSSPASRDCATSFAGCCLRNWPDPPSSLHRLSARMGKPSGGRSLDWADWAPLAPLPPFAGLSHTVQSPTTPVHNPRPTFCSSSDVLTVTPSSCPRQNTEIVECASRIAQAVMDSLRLYRGPGPPQVEHVRVKPPSTSFQSTKLIQPQHGRRWLVYRQSLSHWHWHIKHTP